MLGCTKKGVDLIIFTFFGNTKGCNRVHVIVTIQKEQKKTELNEYANTKTMMPKECKYVK